MMSVLIIERVTLPGVAWKKIDDTSNHIFKLLLTRLFVEYIYQTFHNHAPPHLLEKKYKYSKNFNVQGSYYKEFLLYNNNNIFLNPYLTHEKCSS